MYLHKIVYSLYVTQKAPVDIFTLHPLRLAVCNFPKFIIKPCPHNLAINHEERLKKINTLGGQNLNLLELSLN